MSNPSGLIPKGRAVLVRVEDLQEKARSIIIPENVRSSTAMIETRARVVAIGPACWPDEVPRATVGELVLIAKMAGTSALGPKDGVLYRFINDRDVFAGIEES